MLRSFSKKIATISKIITNTDIHKFAELSGDTNPIHLTTGSERAIVHGAFLNSLVSGVMGTELPGPGSVVVSQTLNFPNKCYVGDNVKISVEIVEDRKIVRVKYYCEVPERAIIVMFGEAKLIVKK